jgi:cell division protein FtsB
VLFVVLIVFFDRNNYVDRAQTKREIDSLRQQRDYYLRRIDEDSMEMVRLRDDAYLEQYAREHFLMRRDSETVYVMERQSPDFNAINQPQ